MIRFLVLCHAGDRTALHVGATLRRRHGTDAVRMLSSDELELGARWSHRLNGATAATRLRLADGTRLDSGRIGVVFNRLLHARAAHFSAAGEVDQGYAVMELYALWMSWLESLPCPVMNPPSVWGLGSQRRSHAEWLVRAAEAGFAVADYRFTTDPRRFGVRDRVPHRRVSDLAGNVRFEPIPAHLVGRRPCAYLESPAPAGSRILVAGEALAGPLAERFRGPLGRLRAAAGIDLFEVEMVRQAGADEGRAGWRLFTVDPFPRFEDPQRVAACAAMLETAAGSGEAGR